MPWTAPRTRRPRSPVPAWECLPDSPRWTSSKQRPPPLARFRGTGVRQPIDPVRCDCGQQVRGDGEPVNGDRVLSLFSGGVHVECRREPPSSRGSQEPVVAQVIVPVARDHIEHQAPKELLQVVSHAIRSAMDSDCPGDVWIRGGIAVVLARQRHGRGVQPASACVSIEAPRHVRSAPTAERKQPGIRDLDAGGARQPSVHIFPAGSVLAIGPRWKLRDP